MRATVLYGAYDGEPFKPRTAEQFQESARCYTRAAAIFKECGDTEVAEMHRRNAARALKAWLSIVRPGA